MTKEDVSRTLRYMEHLRELAGEAETRRDERKLMREYAVCWASIKQYVEGKEPYSE